MIAPSETLPPFIGFDHIAGEYDQVFESNPITPLIRPLIWKSLLAYFIPGTHILELNCGTGTDAIHLAESGIRVTATDSSAKMIACAQEKARTKAVSHLIDFHQMPFENLHKLGNTKFDGAFSNFGGLNCAVNPSRILETLAGLVKPGAGIVVCLINKVSVWEIASFLLRGNLRSAFRRFRKSPVDVRIKNAIVKISYYTPREFGRLLSPWFTIEKVYGLNIISPSPNSRKFASRYPKITTALLRFDERIRSHYPWKSLGDHFVIEARRNS